jgi:hypothetical protein
VHLEARDTEDAVRKAEQVMRIIYPEANVFDSYNAISELEDGDEVVRFVIGWPRGEELIDLSPIVMWKLREELP